MANQQINEYFRLFTAHAKGAQVGIKVFFSRYEVKVGMAIGALAVVMTILAPPVAGLLFGVMVAPLAASIASLSLIGLIISASGLILGFGMLAGIISTVYSAISNYLAKKPQGLVDTIAPNFAALTSPTAAPLSTAIYSGLLAADTARVENNRAQIYGTVFSRPTPAGQVALDVAHACNGKLQGIFKPGR